MIPISIVEQICFIAYLLLENNMLVSCFKCMKLACGVLQASLDLYYYLRYEPLLVDSLVQIKL